MFIALFPLKKIVSFVRKCGKTW